MSKSANRKSRSNEGIILYQNNVGKTVQTSWRPQLPLPKEVVPPTTSTAEPSIRSSEMNRRSSAANTTTSNKKDSYQSAPQISAGGNKKWSFGRLFRKKKEAETESSSEEDRKAGFVVSPKYRKKDKKKRGSKHISGGFDHIVVYPARDNEFFLPFEPIPAGESHSTTHLAPPVDYDPQSRTTNSLDRRGKRDRQQPPGTNEPLRHPSSEEEMISLNSSTTFAKYRSDESLGSGANAMNGQSRRSRAARNERYYKRLSRDGEVSHGQVPQVVMYAAQPAQRWKTQPVPLSVYNGQPNPSIVPVEVNHRPQYPPPVMHHVPTMRNSTSLSHMASHHPISYGMPRQTQNLQNTVNDNKRSISYDSHIHLQNVKKPLPPPPPPRDPMRRVNVANHNDHRPISYAFDQSSSHMAPQNTGMRGRCVSDDRIWSGNAPMYQSASSINHAPPSVASSQNRRFITRAERDAQPGKKSLPSGLDFRYVAEGAPRSRKPIHLFNENENKPPPPPPVLAKPASPVVIRTTKSGLPDTAPPNPQLSSEYWRRGREPHQQRPESIFNKPRSLSSSRAGELRSAVPMYSEVSKPKQKHAATSEEVPNVVSGKLLIKPSKDSRSNYVEIRNNANKSSSMPNHYQRRDLVIPRGPKADSPTPNKYDEYVAEKRVRNILDNTMKLAPDPPQRKVVTKPLALPPEPDVIMRKKPTNLEDAINELEAIYKSLKLGDESLLDRAERRDIPTPTNFEKYAEAHSEEFLDDDDDDEPAGEPDLVRDDFAYRNIKHSNIVPKTPSGEKQPPFGIPVGPIAISPRSDYLHVTPDKDCQKVRTGPFKYPDIVCDDLAVRTLRKDPPGQVKTHFAYPTGSKKRATRTQSANIYTLIQRNAAKPSGGDIDDFLELAKSLERAGSMSDIHKEDDDVPSALQLLRNLREQEHASPKVIPFRHPSQGGAICSLPEVLSKDTKPPIPLPRKSLTPDPESSKMEDALNKIAKEARESSEKLTRDLIELRRGALITTSRTKVTKPNIERDLEQIEAVSEAAKRCRHMLLDTIPPKDVEEIQLKQSPPRRLVTEDKLIKAIDQVSTAANKVCEKILSEIVTVEPPVIVQNAVAVKSPQEQKLIMPSLIQKLDPSSARIGEIAERCMRQISQLNDSPDYDNLHQVQARASNDSSKNDNADLLIVPGSGYVTAAENEEEIDKIMKECEKQARGGVSKATVRVGDQPVTHSDGDKTTTTTATTTSASSSSSDCLKSSSPSVGPHLSSSITSFNPYSSSDYIKSPSSEFHAPSTDPIKTFSTTSYEVQSSSVTPNITNSPFSYSTPSPPLNLTVCSSGGEKGGERSGSASQYNSSEELAMIFGIEKSSPATTTTGKKAEVVDCTVSVPSPVGVFRRSEPNKPDVLSISADTTSATATNPELCESVLVCKLDTIAEDREEVSPYQVSRLYLPSYASNISIIVTSDVGEDDGSGESPRVQTGSGSQQFDSLSSIDESSNPDSGNVSLSDFPVQSPINASLEVELAHNSRFEVAKSFVNEVTISEEPSDMDYLRNLYAQDELSTSFSNEDPEPEVVSDHDEDDQIYRKDQNSPGQLLHEVLSQVSRINAGSNRKQLISQLENISECTKIVEDLSDRLSHQASKLKNSEDTNEISSTERHHRVRFSDECDSEHEEEQSAYTRSLQLLGHDLSSSEESIPPLSGIFNVPCTDSENEDEDEEEDSERSSYIEEQDDQYFHFNEMERSLAEDFNILKEALSKVVNSRQVFEHNSSEEHDLQIESPIHKSLDLEDSLTLSSEVVSVIEVVDSNLAKSHIEDFLSEVKEDQAIDQTSEAVDVLSLVEIRNLEEEDDSLEDSHCKYINSEDLEDVSKTNLHSEDLDLVSKTSLDSHLGKAYLSPVNISLKIVNQVSKISFVDCSDDDLAESLNKQPTNESLEFSYFKNDSSFSQASEVIVVESESDSSLEVQDELNDNASEQISVETKYFSTLDRIMPIKGCDSSTESYSQFESFQRAFDSNFNVDFSEFSSSEVIDEQSSSKLTEMSDSDLVDIKNIKALSSDELAESSEGLIRSTANQHTLSTSQNPTNRVPYEHLVTDPSSSKHHRHLSLESSCKAHQSSHRENIKNDVVNSLTLHRPSSSPANLTASEAPSTSTVSKSLSLLAQPRFDDRMTTLEHVLLVCTLGVVTGNDFITMLAIIIGVLTVIAMVLLT